MAFRFSEQAILDGARLYAASVQQFGRRSAEKYASMMMDAAQLAADFPLSAQSDMAPSSHIACDGLAHIYWFRITTSKAVTSSSSVFCTKAKIGKTSCN